MVSSVAATLRAGLLHARCRLLAQDFWSLRRNYTAGPIALDMQRALGIEKAEAVAFARMTARSESYLTRMAAHRATRTWLRALSLGRTQIDVDLWASKLDAHEGPLVLALPLTTSAVAFLASLAVRTTRPLLVEETPLARVYLRPLELTKPTEMIRRARELGASAERSTVSAPIFVTFPDHHVSAVGASKSLEFLGELHEMPLLEPLLSFRAKCPVFALGEAAEATGTTSRLTLAEYPRLADHRELTPRQVASLLGWLSSAVGSAMRAAPEEVLSWSASKQRTTGAMSIHKFLDAKLVECFLRAWRIKDETIDGDGFRRALADLKNIQDDKVGAA